jgi:hypothetical protein
MHNPYIFIMMGWWFIVLLAVCGAIHEAAGDDLEKECKMLKGCPTGEAKLAGGYLLPSKCKNESMTSLY